MAAMEEPRARPAFDARRIAERLLEDESLRGDLDDASWQVVQDWLLRVLERAQASALSAADVTSVEGELRSVGRAVVETVEAAADGGDATASAANLGQLLGSLLFDRSNKARASRALASAARALRARPAPPAEAARQLVAALDGVLTGARRSAR